METLSQKPEASVSKVPLLTLPDNQTDIAVPTFRTVPIGGELKNLDPQTMTVEELAPIVVAWGELTNAYMRFVLVFIAKTKELPRDRKNRWVQPVLGCYSLRQFFRDKVNRSAATIYENVRKATALEKQTEKTLKRKARQKSKNDKAPNDLKAAKQQLTRAAAEVDSLKKQLKTEARNANETIDRMAAQLAKLDKMLNAEQTKVLQLKATIAAQEEELRVLRAMTMTSKEGV